MMTSALEKASILVEALPYIKKFHGRTVVIKYGGHAMLDEELKKAVLTDIVLMKFVGMHPVVVHGGGPDINDMLKRLDIRSSFVGGLRVTDQAAMEVVEMVLAGKINKEIVSRINMYGGRAVGLSGRDAGLFRAVKKWGRAPGPEGGQPVDIGFVGEIVEVKPEIIDTLIASDYIPVVAPVAGGEGGHGFNVNADTAASALAASLKADKLIILTDVEGILADRNDPSSLISMVRKGEVQELLERGIISGGMIPKVECCTAALEAGVQTTHIMDGRVRHSMLLEIFTDRGIGTMVVP